MKNLISLLVAAVAAVNGAGAPMTVAHRGAPDLAPENTAESFALAAEQGVDAIECDLHLTSDGVLVCHHDGSTGRAWDKDLKIAETTLASLKELAPSAGFKAAYPKYKRVKIPTFEEGVAAMGKSRIFAEIKGGGTECAEALCLESERLKIKDRLTVISYDREAVEYMRDAGYECALLLSFDTASELLAAELPKGVDVDVNYGALTASVVQKLHERGLKVYCYTVEGKRGFESLARLGVDGITGDDFAFLKGR